MACGVRCESDPAVSLHRLKSSPRQAIYTCAMQTTNLLDATKHISVYKAIFLRFIVPVGLLFSGSLILTNLSLLHVLQSDAQDAVRLQLTHFTCNSQTTAPAAAPVPTAFSNRGLTLETVPFQLSSETSAQPEMANWFSNLAYSSTLLRFVQATTTTSWPTQSQHYGITATPLRTPSIMTPTPGTTTTTPSHIPAPTPSLVGMMMLLHTATTMPPSLGTRPSIARMAAVTPPIEMWTPPPTTFIPPATDHSAPPSRPPPLPPPPPRASLSPPATLKARLKKIRARERERDSGVSKEFNPDHRYFSGHNDLPVFPALPPGTEARVGRPPAKRANLLWEPHIKRRMAKNRRKQG
ncbi:hypothetical protein B0H10DRAFT_651777 [Mycena sp. CBHHK59/15]|nr:hypothetical protein B0H10DRAFT_651777 [Mycena sp. CBHHK59/15]